MAPKIAPNTGYGIVNPGTTVPPSGSYSDWIKHEEFVSNDYNATKAAAAGAAGAPPAAPPPPTGPPRLPQLDWATSFFSSLGLPPDVVGKVNQIFSQYSDTTAATAAAMGYIRGTPWYATTYPGIGDAIAKGLVTDESGYRGLLNQQTQIYKQYMGRDISSAEFAANLTEGASSQTIGGRLQGAALAGTYGNDWQYKLGAFGDGQATPDQLQALGQETGGLDTPLGQQMKRRLDMAQQRLQGVFSGSLATPSLSMVNGRLSAPGLGGGAKPDIAS